MSENLAEDDFSIIESAEEVLIDRSIEDQISNNYYIEEYLSIFHSKEGIKNIRQTALQSGLRSCRFRSMCWRVFLECLPETTEERIAKTNEFRDKYEIICNKYNRDPRDVKSAMDKAIHDGPDNPLSQDETSQWNQYFTDSELRSRISQDVIRTFPEIDFFQLPQIQSVMINILFHFASENPAIDYKQGMHELLAPLLFVIHCDHQTFLHAEEIGLIEEEIKILMDPEFIEHDSYYLFCGVMERVESWYDNHSIQTKPEAINLEPFSAPSETSLYSVLGVKLKMINEQIVRRQDYELYHHLVSMEIAPQIYGIRWMRLLFGREFQMQDLLVVWDAIFADGFALCDYIFAAMLLVIKKLLLVSDYAQCLYHLMRYPSVPDIHYIIHLALHIRDPLNYSEPVGYSSLVMPNAPNLSPGGGEPQILPPPTSKTFPKSNGQPAVRPTTLGVHSADSTVSRKSSTVSNSPAKKLSTNKRVDSELSHISSIDFPADEESDQLRDENNELKLKIEYCWEHMTDHLEALQRLLTKEPLAQEDEAMVALAELKKCRDILKGTLRFGPNNH